MQKLKGKSVYISGAISSDKGYVEKFKDWASKAIEAGATRVINPAELLPKTGHTYEEYIMTDLAFVARCDAILMLPCWMTSPGAKAELALAECLKKEVVYA